MALAAATRSDPMLRLGASPRAAIQLLRVAKSLAAMHGRDHVLPDDVQELAVPVLAHRLLPSTDARLSGRSVAETVRHDRRHHACPRRRPPTRASRHRVSTEAAARPEAAGSRASRPGSAPCARPPAARCCSPPALALVVTGVALGVPAIVQAGLLAVLAVLAGVVTVAADLAGPHRVGMRVTRTVHPHPVTVGETALGHHRGAGPSRPGPRPAERACRPRAVRRAAAARQGRPGGRTGPAAVHDHAGPAGQVVRRPARDPPARRAGHRALVRRARRPAAGRGPAPGHPPARARPGAPPWTPTPRAGRAAPHPTTPRCATTGPATTPAACTGARPPGAASSSCGRTSTPAGARRRCCSTCRPTTRRSSGPSSSASRSRSRCWSPVTASGCWPATRSPGGTAPTSWPPTRCSTRPSTSSPRRTR